MTIYYLYIKTHNKTGLKYLGYTKRKDTHKYKGSGEYWTKHLNEHGYDVTTEILKECSTKDEIKHWGLYYSNMWNIVVAKNEQGDKIWANLRPEEGDGGKTREVSANKGKVTVKDVNGNTFMVELSDPRLARGDVHHINKGTIGVQDKTGNKFRVDVSDPRLLTGELTTFAKGKVTVIDEYGNTKLTSVDDPDIKSGKVRHMFTGKITVVDKDGNTMKVSVDDPRVISGELTSFNKGKVAVIDKNGIRMYVSVNDPRYLSGDLKTTGGGKKGYKQPKIECPHCGITGGISNMKRSHMDKCKFRSVL